MSVHWESITVDDWLRDDDGRTFEEPLGGKEKFWITGPDGHDYLFKYARCDPDGGNVRGEDWAEWVVHQLAELIGVPTAVVLPATCQGRRGSLSRAVWHQRERLIHGNELLARRNPGYDEVSQRENPGYTVDAVYAVLDGVEAPPGCAAPVSSGFDAWAGYLMLDAWVAGRDRHDLNWAVIDDGGVLHLAPSFDHGNALGFQEPERKVAGLAIDEGQLARWCGRGTSFHFAGKPTLVEVAAAALQRATPAARGHWRSRIAQVSVDKIAAILDQIPDAFMSDPGRTFRIKLLTYNRERIIDDQ